MIASPAKIQELIGRFEQRIARIRPLKALLMAPKIDLKFWFQKEGHPELELS
jgi:hypothetical protein